MSGQICSIFSNIWLLKASSLKCFLPIHVFGKFKPLRIPTISNWQVHNDSDPLGIFFRDANS